MDSLEIRKARLDIVFKLFYPFLVVLGALIVFFSHAKIEKPGYGDIVLLGLAAFLIVFILVMICYMFHEIVCFKVVKEETDAIDNQKAENSYKDLFKCFSVGGLGLLGYIVILVGIALYQKEPIICVSSLETHIAIYLALSLFFCFIPSDVFLAISAVKAHPSQGGTVDGFNGGSKPTVINLNKFKQGRWTTWGIFVFYLLYYVWFNK